MAVNKAYSQYKSNSITTASPEELTLMLYNGLMRFLMQADKAIENKETEKAHENIVRAQDIIMEFQATLDMQYDISHNLLQLYDYMHRRLIEANIKKDRKIIGEVLHFATELRDTWSQAMKLAKEQVAAAQTVVK
jgi:flagellar protein FliS